MMAIAITSVAIIRLAMSGLNSSTDLALACGAHLQVRQSRSADLEVRRIPASLKARTTPMICLPHDIQQHCAVNAVAVPGTPSEKRRGVVLRLHTDETVVASQAPTARVPLDAATDVAGEERLGVGDAKLRLIEHAQSANASSDVWHD